MRCARRSLEGWRAFCVLRPRPRRRHCGSVWMRAAREQSFYVLSVESRHAAIRAWWLAAGDPAVYSTPGEAEGSRTTGLYLTVNGTARRGAAVNRWAWNPRRSLLCTVSYSIAVSSILQLAASVSTSYVSGAWVIGPYVEAGCAALRYYMSIANLPPLLPSPLCVHAPPRRTRSGSTRPPAGTANANESRKRIEQPSRVHPSPRLCFCTLYSVLCSLESRVHPRTGSLRARTRLP